MEFKTHNEMRIDIGGTHLQEVIDISYDDLMFCFGTPTNGCDQTRAEWHIVSPDGVVATIYDWKKYEPVELVRQWNIGGHNKRAVELVIDLIAERLFGKPNRRIRMRLRREA